MSGSPLIIRLDAPFKVSFARSAGASATFKANMPAAATAKDKDGTAGGSDDSGKRNAPPEQNSEF
jgi:hypothetical protein